MFALVGQRIPVKCRGGGKSKTQQQFKKDCDINSIYKHYVKYGVIPENVVVKVPKFQDNGKVPTFQQAQDMMIEASNLYSKVPLEIRRLCDHDPAKVADFLCDEKNRDILNKHGLLKEKKVEEPNYLKEIAETLKKGSEEPAAQLPT